MKKNVLIAAFLLFGGVLFAQQEKGDLIVRFNGNFSKYGEADGTANINVKGGYFVTKNIEGGAETTLMLGSGFSNVSVGAYGTYNFLTSDAKMVPYAGGRASLSVASVGEFSNSFATVGAYGGLRYFMTEKVNIDTGLSYDIGTVNILMWNVGIGVILGKK